MYLIFVCMFSCTRIHQLNHCRITPLSVAILHSFHVCTLILDHVCLTINVTVFYLTFLCLSFVIIVCIISFVLFTEV